MERISIVSLFKRIILFACLLTFFSCATGKAIDSLDPEDVESVLFGTLPKGIETPYQLSTPAWVVLSDHYRDTVIYETGIIRRYVSQVKELRSIRNKRKQVKCDIRIVSIINRRGKAPVVVCYAEPGREGTVYYEFEDASNPNGGIVLKDNPAIFAFLDSLLYLPHSDDYWATPIEKSMEWNQ